MSLPYSEMEMILRPLPCLSNAITCAATSGRTFSSLLRMSGTTSSCCALLPLLPQAPLPSLLLLLPAFEASGSLQPVRAGVLQPVLRAPLLLLEFAPPGLLQPDNAAVTAG